MATGGEYPSLVEAIGACRRRVVVVCGPARSGKTTAALATYERGLADPTRPTCLLLGPNRLTVQYLRRELLARSPAGLLVAPRVTTLASLADEVLATAGLPHRPISPIRRRLALRNIIADLFAAGKLTALARLADAPGLVDAVDRSIAELKRAAVEPEALADVVAGEQAAHRDLIAIYAAYQQHLLAGQWYDTEGKMWLAREELTDRTETPLPGIRTIIADGFTDFTPTQLTILRLLSSHVDRLVITLPVAEEPGRAKLWRWTARQLHRIERVFAETCERVTATPAGDGPFDAVVGRTFSLDGAAIDWPDGLAAVETAGIDSECRAIVRWVKGHLAAGAATDDMAVVVRNADAYLPTLSRVFAEAELTSPAPATPLAQTPLGRLLTALVRMADRFAFADVLTVIGSSYFRPEVLGPFGPETPAVAEWLIRHGNVLEGRGRYAAAAARLAARALNAVEMDDEFTRATDRRLRQFGPGAIELAGQMLEELFTLADPLSAGGTLGELAHACRAAIVALRLGAPVADADAPSHAADLRAAAAIDGVLGELVDAEQAGRSLTPAAFVDLLTDILRETTCPSGRASGAVRVVGALDARAIRVRHVWLAGLNAGMFPTRAGEQALLGEADRRAWADKGLPLDVRDDLAAREMLLFYLTVSRADVSLTLSWLYSDSAGRTTERSRFVDELCRPLGGLGGRVEALPPAEFAPPAERIVSEPELLNAAMAAAAAAGDDEQAAGWQPALAAARYDRAGSLCRLAWPLWAAHRRWRAGPCDPYDGVLDDGRLLAQLCDRVPGKTTFSVSQLGGYLRCRWRYFAERWLHLTELAEPAEDMLPRARGLLVHEVLRRTLASLSEAGPLATTDLASDEAMAALSAAIDAEAEAAAAFGVAYPALWANELRHVRRAAERYLRAQADGAGPPGHVRSLEFAFGLPEASKVDPQSSPTPAVLAGPSGPVRIRGKIDRVDIVEWPAGQPRALVIDYKTGYLPSTAGDVQLPVYIKAVEQATGMSVCGGAFHAVQTDETACRTLAQFKMSRALARDDDSYDEKLQAGLDLVHEAVAGIAAGQFGVFGRHGCAGTSCPFRPICGYSDARATVKAAAHGEGGDE